MRHPIRLFPCLFVAVAACAAVDDVGEPAAERTQRERADAPREATPRSQNHRYYRVSRLDYRKCVFPLCGGVFVAEVNHAQSRCADGQDAADCYASDFDLSGLALGAELELEVRNLAKDGDVLLRGELIAESTPHGDIGKLVVAAAYRGATLNDHADPTYLVVDSGIVCITHPCFSLAEHLLNSEVSGAVAGLDLATSGATEDDQNAAALLLATPGLLVAGSHAPISGPAGEGTQLIASEFYLPVAATNAACAHSECDAGVALETSCSSCATTVCNVDSFCCDNAWDGLCVKEAGELCNVCDTQPPPPPVCAHDECETGVQLDAACSSCATDVCNQDAFCCDSAWDALCVKQAGELCSACAPPAPTCAHSECTDGGMLDAGCSTCATVVCSADAYCCSTAWDGVCVEEAVAWCDEVCG